MADMVSNGWGCDAQRASTSTCKADLEMVVLGTGVRDTCSGDSGGPLFERDGQTWLLVGVTSGSFTRTNLPCGDGGIYTRADAMRG